MSGTVSVPFRGFRGLQVVADELIGLGFGGFQSPSGVLGVCRKEEANEYLQEQNVSVPFRGFRGLQGLHEFYSGIVNSPFQSPSGVLGVCRCRGLRVHSSCARTVSVPFRGFRGLQVTGTGSTPAKNMAFQSPSGVLGVCRVRRSSPTHLNCSSFSPLPGF